MCFQIYLSQHLVLEVPILNFVQVISYSEIFCFFGVNTEVYIELNHN